ncbi:GIY-YIG nuclease family protein [Methylovirgula sp. 4M-Z18]|uniref:GIY-YIG nuclease family protein n=1 Tax=Methylovirgula sp. 4M-Z18 TaxID=2293567 RepID=UPI000E2ECEAA|nr:GIY-YIG nuclease family protein [Methylovirgula sp. 4M-Z18]RFB76413.1 GIY-YIG nuclease family protein [Methylovirgula sp. 4M-Z18]
MTEARRAAIAAYKKRESPAGIYAVRCSASGEVWVGQAPDLDKIRNRIWFELWLGTHSRTALQRAWRIHGEHALVFDILERLESQESAYLRDALLKKRVAFWRAKLGAHPL